VSQADIAKIEWVAAPQNFHLGVDLYLDKRDGLFFADVGGKRVQDKTKKGAIEKVRARLVKITAVEWRQVILLRIESDTDEDDGDDAGRENDKQVYRATCSFTYLRRERAANPLKPKETIEREHPIEFEERVVEEKRRIAVYEKSPLRKKERAEARERELRVDRDALKRVERPWSTFRKGTAEYELPYSPESWAGIQRISQTLREMQNKLNAFARGATPAKLAQLAIGDVLRLLPPGSREMRRTEGKGSES
jgi:hypothetical protein